MECQYHLFRCVLRLCEHALNPNDPIAQRELSAALADAQPVLKKLMAEWPVYDKQMKLDRKTTRIPCPRCGSLLLRMPSDSRGIKGRMVVCVNQECNFISPEGE